MTNLKEGVWVQYALYIFLLVFVLLLWDYAYTGFIVYGGESAFAVYFTEYLFVGSSEAVAFEKYMKMFFLIGAVTVLLQHGVRFSLDTLTLTDKRVILTSLLIGFVVAVLTAAGITFLGGGYAPIRDFFDLGVLASTKGPFAIVNPFFGKLSVALFLNTTFSVCIGAFVDFLHGGASESE